MCVRWVSALLAMMLAASACGTPSPTGPTMSISDARAVQLPGSKHPILVEATITNVTGHEDALVGGSSSITSHVEIDGTSSCCALPAPTDVGTGLNDMIRMEWLPITPGQTLILQGGSGHLTLVDPAHIVEPGQTVDVTFRFQESPPVTLQVRVQ